MGSSKKSSFQKSGHEGVLATAQDAESRRLRPILVVGMHRGCRRVIECCSAANRRGIRKGMTLTEAKALTMSETEGRRRLSSKAGSEDVRCMDSVIVVAPTPARDQADLRRLAEKCLRFAPITAIDEPAGILLDLSGCRRMLDRRDGESGLLDRIERAFEDAGLLVTTAIADTAVAARAWAGYRTGVGGSDGDTSSRIIPRGRQAGFLASLPVECLGLSAETLEAIHEVNVRSIDELQRLPRSTLPVRYGGAVLCRLDQAMGRLPLVLDPVRPRITISEVVEFNGPVRARQAIELAIVDLLNRVRRRLEELESGARVVRVRVERPDLPAWVRGVELRRATRRREHLWTMLQPIVECLPLDDGVDSIELEIPRYRRLRHEPAVMIGGAIDDARVASREADTDRAAFIDLIQSRFGAGSVRRAAGLSGHVPEDEARIEPVDQKDLESPASSFQIGPPARSLRPTVLHRPPVPVEVECRGEEPVAIIRGKGRWGIDAAEGPECIGAPWWRLPDSDSTEDRLATGQELQRDYWRLRIDSGVWIWIFKSASTGRWFLHGAWA
jgi:protein ImuB